MSDKTKMVQENLQKITPSFAVSLIPCYEGEKKVIVFCDLPENAWEEINKEQTEKLIEAL